LPLHKDAGSPISPTVIGAVGARSPSASPSDVLLGFLGYMSKDFAPTSMPSRPTNSTMSARIC
jgi:hypothetical protein